MTTTKCVTVLSLERKLDIIAQVRKGKLQRAAAKLFDAAKSKVGDIWKIREKVERHVSASANPVFAKKRCIMRDVRVHKLDEASC